jgi:hypothetical protein
MTGVDWLLAADLQGFAAMERHLEGLRTHRRKVGRRKMRLFGCACCQSVWELLSDRERSWIAEAERIADGEVPVPADANSRYSEIGFGTLEKNLAQARFAAWCTLSSNAKLAAWTVAAHVSLATGPHQYADHCRVLREVFGNPFCPITLIPSHRTSTVVSLARAAYGERRLPSGELDACRLAVLADALEDAGAEGEILAHLRTPGPHVLGCWALDLCLDLN